MTVAPQLKRVFFFLFVAALCCCAYAGYEAYAFLHTPASAFPKDVVIDITPGAAFDKVARDLHALGAISGVDRFRMLAWARRKLASVQTGEFTVNTGWTPDQVLSRITSGKAMLYKLALREGLAWWDVARLVEEGGFAKADEFEAVIHDPDFLRRYGIPFANAEGFLYPETYLLRKPRALGGRAQAEAVAAILLETFWKRSWPEFARHEATSVSAESLRHIVTLASLVEKETGVAAERGRVAGVYANRMRIGMLLQCDPTIIYGIGKSFAGPIRRSHLEDAGNRYNTYKHPGLPPGPVCSPGAESIKAAAAPESHKYLYFVATGRPDGTHVFSTNLRDHEKAVRAYRATRTR